MRKPHRGAAIDPEERSLIAELYPALRRFASTVRNPGQDGNDLVQEALLRVLERGALLKLDHPASYLRRVILNLAIDHSRWAARERRVLHRMVPPTSPSPSYSWDLDELRSIPPKARAAIFLHSIEGRPYSEIAEMLGCTQVSARVAASRGRKQLQDALVKEADDATA